MPVALDFMKLILLIPMAAFIVYYDVRYRRIPNVLVLSLLIGGLTLNICFGGFSSVDESGRIRARFSADVFDPPVWGHGRR